MKLTRLLLLAALISVAMPAAVHADESPEPALAQLLQRRAEAITAGDEAAFMDTVVPSADPRFRAAQQRSFRGMRAAGVANVSFAIVGQLDAAGPLSLKSNQDGAALLPQTRFTYRITGYDDRDAWDTQYLTYVKRDGRWWVASDSDGSVLGLQTQRNIWDVSDVARIESPGFVTLFRPDQRARADALQTTASVALDRFRQTWNRPWSGRIPLIIPPGPEEAAQLLENGQRVEDFTAFVTYRTSVDGGWSVSAPRMLAQDGNLGAASPDSQVATMVHELTHAASVPLDGPFTPAWLHEGVAEWVRMGRPLERAPGTTGALALPASDRFATSGTELGAAYADAASAVSYLASRYGADAPIRLLEVVGGTRRAAGTPAYNMDQAVRQVTGGSLADFTAAWNQMYAR